MSDRSSHLKNILYGGWNGLYKHFCLKTFLPFGGISEKLSPRYIMVVRVIDVYTYFFIDVGAYTQVYEENDNSMAQHKPLDT